MRVMRIVGAIVVAGLLSGCGGFFNWIQGGSGAGTREVEEVPAPVEAAAVAAAEAPIVATMRVIRTRRILPADLEDREVVVRIEEGARVEEVAGRLADVLAVDVAVEDRPARDGAPVTLPEVPMVRFVFSAQAREVLNQVGSRMGYEWEYVGSEASPRIVLYRHVDAAWRERMARPSMMEREVWRIEPWRHDTVRAVLEDWAVSAGWTVVWEAEDLDYAVTATATFHGTFEEAVDGLLRDTRGYRTLIPTAWRANRYLTVKAGG